MLFKFCYLNAFYWYQIFALDSAFVEAQKMLTSHAGFLTIAMYHHREILNYIKEFAKEIKVMQESVFLCNMPLKVRISPIYM